MKKTILLAAIALLGISTINAQTEKGKWVFGSDAGISFTSTTAKAEFDGNQLDGKTTSSTFEINPNAGYFIIDNLAIGLDLSFSTTKNKFDDGMDISDDTTNAFGVLPSATYYFKNDKLAPYLGVGVGFLSISSGDEDFNKSSGLAVGATGGLAYFLNTSVSLNFGVTYLYSNQTNKAESDFKVKSNVIGANIGFAVYL